MSETTVDEIADGIYRISTPLDVVPGGFSFNQFLIVDEDPLLFHTGLRNLFPVVKGAIERVLPIAKLRYVSFSHVEADECGALNKFLEVAPRAQPLCGHVAAMVSVNDLADRPAKALADGERLSLGKHEVEWYDAPHVPHGWECGFLGERTTNTLFCGDLFTQAGSKPPAITESDILGPSEGMRKAMDYYAHGPNTKAVIERLAATKPRTLATMHGSSWRGDGEKLLRALAGAVTQPAR